MSISRISIIIGVVIAVICMSIDFACADQKTEELIAKLEAQAKTINSYSADLTMNMEVMGQKMVSTGKLLFKKPQKSRMDMTTKMGGMEISQSTVSDGKTTWTYQPQMNIVQKIDMEKILSETGNDLTKQNNGNLSDSLEGMIPGSISYIKTEKVNGEQTYVFEGKPKVSQMNNMPFSLEKMKLWLSVKDGMPRKVVIFDKDGKEIMTQEYSNIKINIDIPDSQFEFNPPEGVQVTDMTDSTIQMMKQMNK